ncbi:MAG: SEL1-like repeat protein [Alphaproteobacteria bacterium]|nr:SEL1-like repeat protein [Alphaproteobacteria bacterium]
MDVRRFGRVFSGLLIVMLLQSAPSATADYYDGLRAYDAKDFAAALAEWRPASDAGDAQSQFRLAELLEHGLGTPQNFVRAHLYYNLAGAQGNEEARARRDAIGEMMTGEELAEARKLAADWVSRVAVEPVSEPSSASAESVEAEPSVDVTAPPPPSDPGPEISDAGTIREAQTILTQIGFDAGPVDGVIGAKTRDAISEWQSNHDREQTARLTTDVLAGLREIDVTSIVTDKDLIREAQTILWRAGRLDEPGSAITGVDFRYAIGAWQSYGGMKPTYLLTPDVLEALRAINFSSEITDPNVIREVQNILFEIDLLDLYGEELGSEAGILAGDTRFALWGHELLDESSMELPPAFVLLTPDLLAELRAIDLNKYIWGAACACTDGTNAATWNHQSRASSQEAVTKRCRELTGVPDKCSVLSVVATPDSVDWLGWRWCTQETEEYIYQAISAFIGISRAEIEEEAFANLQGDDRTWQRSECELLAVIAADGSHQ